MGFPCDYYFKGRKLTYDQFRKELKGLPMSEIEGMFPTIKDEGIKSIAWTTGEQQNERYDLSKSVSKIEIKKKGDNYEVKAYDKGDQVQVTPIKEETVSEKELEGVVGKEIANKAINEGQTSFEGADLKVGGKGMKGFYGSPNVKISGSEVYRLSEKKQKRKQ